MFSVVVFFSITQLLFDLREKIKKKLFVVKRIFFVLPIIPSLYDLIFVLVIFYKGLIRLTF